MAEFAHIFLVDESNLYFSSNASIFTTDLSVENEKTIYEYKNGEWMGSYYYDQKTNELFFIIGNDKENTGSVYVYRDGVLEKVNLPHENIYSFQLTNSKIYYSPYNPIHYGTSPRGGEVYDYIGGKIYVTDRDDPKESELIFDCGREFAFPNGYTMIGDYLYFDCMQIIRQGDYAWFSSALELKKVRINIKEHTIKYLSFD